MMSSDRRNRRWRLWTTVICTWAGANAVLYWTLSSSERRSPPSRQSIPVHALQAFEKRTFRSSQPANDRREALRYRLMKPDSLEAGRRYPLLLFLHGAGERGGDNRRQLQGLPARMARPEWRERFPCFLAAPQCPAGGHWSDQMEFLEKLVEKLIEEHPIDRRRIYLTGLSMGGFGSWELAARRPELFAAVVPICGGGDPSDAEKLVDVPIWAVHGDADEAVPVEHTRRMIAEVRRAGGNPRYTELEGVGHNSWTPTYRDPDGGLAWMFRQRNASMTGDSEL